MKTVAILQSNYIPWKGYFDMIAAVDEFILYDDMQYTRRDWRNRNQIKTPQGTQWLTIPVKVKGKYLQTIKDTEIDGEEWSHNHWKTLRQNYQKAPYYADVAEVFEPIYLGHKHHYLAALNRQLITAVCGYLGITTKISSSSDFILKEGKTERLVDLCRKAGGAAYLSGPAAKDYIDPMLFENEGIQLKWFEYGGYPEYPQRWGDFEHSVTIMDLLFNCGKKSSEYMKFAKPPAS
jgi:hypothetical protein